MLRNAGGTLSSRRRAISSIRNCSMSLHLYRVSCPEFEQMHCAGRQNSAPKECHYAQALESSAESAVAQKVHSACALHKHTHAWCARLPVTAAQSLDKADYESTCPPGEPMRTALASTSLLCFGPAAGAALAARAPALSFAQYAAPAAAAAV